MSYEKRFLRICQALLFYQNSLMKSINHIISILVKHLINANIFVFRGHKLEVVSPFYSNFISELINEFADNIIYTVGIQQQRCIIEISANVLLFKPPLYAPYWLLIGFMNHNWEHTEYCQLSSCWIDSVLITYQLKWKGCSVTFVLVNHS